jgi:hypothetical protein
MVRHEPTARSNNAGLMMWFRCGPRMPPAGRQWSEAASDAALCRKFGSTDSNSQAPVVSRANAPSFAVVPPPKKVRGMERREAHLCNRRRVRRGARPDVGSATPHGAPSRRFWAGGPCFRARPRPPGPLIQPAFAGPRPVLVQPLKAAPRSGHGR